MTDFETSINSKAIKLQAVTQLLASANGCVQCDLHLTRTKVVFGVGNPSSPLMLVGEGPGANEDATGLPFVGRAGRLLDECLSEAGMKREHVYITNIVKCRACIVDGRSVKNRAPTTQEIGTCVPLWLDKQVDLIQPLVILCLGAPSANAVIGKPIKITLDRGRWFECKYARYVMPALHPAYILRQEGQSFDQARSSLVSDLTAAKEKAREAKREPKTTLF